MNKIMLGCGCFWGTEAYFKRLNGVTNTEVGYGQGDTDNPNYKEVCTGTTGHIEVCMIEYDQTVISTETLINHFYKVINPTQTNGQAGDRGPQYMSGIFYFDDEQRDVAIEVTKQEQIKHSDPITTQISKFKNFYPAEEHHQDYLTKNPSGYCHINVNALLGK